VSSFDERRRARAAWPIRRTTLESEPLTDDRLPDDLEARLAMVTELTYTQWRLAGRELPQYTRAEMPGRVIRPK
jgi:hypothetical protein